MRTQPYPLPTVADRNYCVLVHLKYAVYAVCCAFRFLEHALFHQHAACIEEQATTDGRWSPLRPLAAAQRAVRRQRAVAAQTAAPWGMPQELPQTRAAAARC